MVLKDIADMNDYLENRCYCPYEIYDMTGFFYELFYPDTECRVLCTINKGAIHGTFVIATPKRIGSENIREQIIYIEITDNKVDSCVRIDNTVNNRKQIKMFMNGEIEKMVIDKYEEGETQKALDEVMSIADAIMI